VNPSFFRKLRTDVIKDWDLYVMLIPGIIFLIIFKYTPMYGNFDRIQRFQYI
jgi:ABC-type polysaccharide transport system, permease component